MPAAERIGTYKHKPVYRVPVRIDYNDSRQSRRDMAAKSYGIQWPDGSFTGGITDKYHHATAYAKQHDGVVYTVGSDADPEVKQEAQPCAQK